MKKLKEHMRKRFDMIFYYCCTQENNNCPNKETCMRYLNAESEPHTTLYKYSCTEENNYHLYMKKKDDNIINNKEENKNEETKND